MGLFTARYYDQVKDYLHPDLHDFVHYCRQGNIFDLPLYDGCNKKNRNRTRKLIEYNQGHQSFQLINFIGEKLMINTKE